MSPDLDAIASQVSSALAEDLGVGDVSASLIEPSRRGRAILLTRQAGVLAGRAWAETAFRLLDPACNLRWSADDGEEILAGQQLCVIEGQARAMLSAERTALNFLQLLSGVATSTRHYVDSIAGTGARLLDTRKTLPGLRLAQKYAVRMGGGHNHRLGLYDMVMLKENHITAAGGIQASVALARQQHPGLTVEVEVETLEQLEQALAADADRIMLDNFGLEDMRLAVEKNQGRAILEASGGLELNQLRQVAETGVDDISVGALTKTIIPLDLSLRFE
ncbi:MAG: carboxylating nicotinate-nucleotide diphosphorylase [Wenzhouxiangella sp.]|nr:carboxylating nicotinate-nucleotide diphosphorylase [Wenzhouxiangella sp.]MCH8476748.1 carboxylating nicotinate-nucleotide diphosphorylase [Wenzhouxiangella sp.]TVR93770.1 MAG: carboxylating nicotinate-nucleotide diphosphorylase [Wenzhouxiangellaceae bacterium]